MCLLILYYLNNKDRMVLLNSLVISRLQINTHKNVGIVMKQHQCIAEYLLKFQKCNYF